MFSRIRGSDKKDEIKEKLECKCVKVPITESLDEDKAIPVDCSSQPGFCVVGQSGRCTKLENAPHCSLSPVELIGEICVTDDGPQMQLTQSETVSQSKCSESGCGGAGKVCGAKYHKYKVDLNNAEDTGLVVDKQCQTCGPQCSPVTCSSRTREFFINWDKRRTRILISLISVFAVWICVYGSVATTMRTTTP